MGKKYNAYDNFLTVLDKPWVCRRKTILSSSIPNAN